MSKDTLTPMALHQANQEQVDIGKTGTQGGKPRDAIHFACAWVQADHVMMPGTWVELINKKAHPTTMQSAIGIIDPFLAKSVKEDEWCWVILKPGTITGLKHHWTHPAFPEDEVEEGIGPDALHYTKEQSKAWITDYLNNHPNAPSYEKFMEEAEAHVKEGGTWGDYLTIGGQDAGGEFSEEIWWHFENVTGIHVPDNLKATQFSCSC